MNLTHDKYESAKELQGITDKSDIIRVLAKSKTYLHAADKANVIPCYDVSLDEIDREYIYWMNYKPNLVYSDNLTPSKQLSKINFNYGVWYVLNNQFFKLFVSCIDAAGTPCAYQLRFRINDTDFGREISGRDSFQRFRAELKKDGVDIEKFAIDNGKKLKSTVDFGNPVIQFDESIKDKTIESAHHVDMASAYMYFAGIYHPEWEKTIHRIYDLRKSNNVYKHILTHACGFFQSQYCVLNGHGYALADVSSFAIRSTAIAVKKMAKELSNYGFKILAFNTDGVWFCGDLKLFPREKWEKLTEIKKIGNFSIDHKNCTIRFKSVGSYEYMENGKYTPVVRGLTRYDRAGLARDDWNWGYIYTPEGEQIEVYKFEKNTGLRREYVAL